MMTFRALTSLTLCTAAISTASMVWASPAQAILLRFTGFATNGEETGITFSIDSETDLSLLDGGFSESIVQDIEISNLIFNGSEILTAQPGLQRSYFASTGTLSVSEPIDPAVTGGPAGVDIQNAGGFIDKTYTIDFIASTAEPPTLDQPSQIAGTFSFGLANNLDDLNSETLFGDNDGAFDANGILDLSPVGGSFELVPDGFDFATDLVRADESTDVPEPTALLGLAVMGFAGVAHAAKKRQKNA